MTAIIFALLLIMPTPRLNLNQYLNPNHTDIFRSTDRELVVRGGANAGKTYSIADKLLLQSILQSDKRLRAVLIRKTLPSLKDTVLDILQRRAEVFKLPLTVNQQTNIATCHNMTFLLRSLNNTEDYIKIKSMTDIDFIWVNEITDLRENDYEILDTRIRGGESSFKQFIIDFNPIGKSSWVYDRFYIRDIGKARKLKYTVLDNPWASKDEIDRLRAKGEHNPNFYRVYFEGEWGELEGVIYDWDPASLPSTDLAWYDEIFYGGDFGYSVDPAALVRIYRKANEFWVEQVIYQTGLTNQALGRLMLDEGITRDDLVYWDSAEPKSIQELCDMGLTAIPAEKGPDSVRAGIDYLKEVTIHIVDGSTDILKECRAYTWKKDKDDRALNVPVESFNHTMDAIRYGIFSHLHGMITDAEIIWA